MIVNCKSHNVPYVQRDNMVALYCNEIRKFPILSISEQRKLLEKTKSKNEFVRQKAIEQLVNCNQRFVMSAAKKATNGTDLLDLINEGNIGLMTAIEKFDLNKNVGFITYAAFWVKKYINEYLAVYRNMVIPANAQKLRNIVTKAKNEFFKKEERTPTLNELQAILKEKYEFSVSQLQDLETYQLVSIEETSTDDDGDMYNENIAYIRATSSNNINKDVEMADYKIMVEKLLNKLNDRDRIIITKAFGIGCIEQTCESIADDVDLSKERIRQKIGEILNKLRKMSNNYNIFEN